MEKRGQVAIFVIIAIVIVVAGILVYMFLPQARNLISGEVTPTEFIQRCVEDEVQRGVEILSKQGGYLEPEGYIMYQDNKVKYLCYTAQYYLPCKVQQPLIKRHFERELEGMIAAKTAECLSEMKRNYESRGFEVDGGDESSVGVDIIPGVMNILVSAPMTISRGGDVQRFNSFNVNYPSRLYEILAISHSIIDFEATLGDTSTDLYYAYYPNLVIYKNKLGDGTTIYKVRDVTTREEFNFASRSLAWPGGLGLNG